MEILWNGLGLACALAALAGYSMLLSRKTALNSSLAPAVACAGISLMLTASGMLGVLWHGAVLLWGCGTVLFVWELWQRRKTPGTFFCAPAVFLLLGFIYAAIRLYGIKLLHYDNFSHWALMADHLLTTDSLPGAGNLLISFTSYPPASACFIYFFARLSGAGEGVMAFGQAVWIFCCGATLFGFVQKRKATAYVLLCIAFLSMLIANVFLDELLVDTLLPMVGLAAVAVIVQLKEQPKQAALAALPICMVLPLIKTSGLFFACVAIALVIMLGLRQNRKRTFPLLLLLVVGVVAALLLWRLHVLLVFGSAEGRHAVDGGAYVASFTQKLGSGVLWQTVKNFAKRLVDFWAVHNQLLLAMVLCLGLLWIAGPKRKAAGYMLAAVFGLWVLWQMGILGMYAFSATDREALNLSGQQRYSLSMAIYLMGLCSMFVLWLLNASWEGHSKLLCALLCTLLTLSPLLPLHGSVSYLWRGLASPLRRSSLEQALSSADVAQGKRYVLYVDDYTQVSYVTYLGRYLLHSPYVTAVDGDSYLNELSQALTDADYLIFTDDNPRVEQFAREQIGKQGNDIQIVTMTE